MRLTELSKNQLQMIDKKYGVMKQHGYVMFYDRGEWEVFKAFMDHYGINYNPTVYTNDFYCRCEMVDEHVDHY